MEDRIRKWHEDRLAEEDFIDRFMEMYHKNTMPSQAMADKAKRFIKRLHVLARIGKITVDNAYQYNLGEFE